MKIISQYILSNDYTVDIQTNFIQNQAVLRDSVGFSIQVGPKNFGATEIQLVNQIITDYQPTGLKNDNNNWSVVPTIIEKVGAPPAIPPIVKLYTVEGRIANKNTQEPIQGIKVYISSSLPIENKNYGVTSSMDPNTPEKYKQGYETKSDVDGIWELTFKIETEEVVPDVFSVIETPDIIFESEDMLFGEEKRKPYAGDNDVKTVKSSLDIVQMKPFVPDLKKQTTKLKNIAGEEINKLKSIIPKDPMQALQKAVGKKIQDIIRKFLPLIVGMIAKFGISKLTEALRNGFKKFDKKNCPSPKELKKLIKKRNKIVKILNAIYKFVDALVKASGLVLTLIQIFRLVKSIVVNIPIPQATGVFPAKDGGGLAYAQPMSATLKNADAINKFETIIKKYEFLTIMVLAILTVLRAVLKMAIDLLKGLDGLIETCADEYLEKEEITLEEINADLLESLKEEEEVQLDPFLNGFELSVVPIPNTKVGSITRRQAIAKNKDNIILLRGEPSYSASDQILIDELRFYITQNNLKAN